jgi:hypothetical protein
MQITMAHCTKLTLTILDSVLRTVAKFRFSLVRKYFWFLERVDREPDTL